MILKSRFKKNNSVPSHEFSKELETAEMESYEETEVTVSEEEDGIYGYNTYSHEEQRRPGIPEAVSRLNCESFANPAEDDSQSRHRMPRRSSLKGSSATPRQFRRHSLTFCNDVSVSTITPTRELAKKKLWFEGKDYEKIHKKIQLIAQRAQLGEPHKHCTRGLEKMLRSDCETRKHAAWNAVLDEQEHQMESGAEYYDGDALSQFYRVVCEESRAEATALAKQDEKDVAAYLCETRRYCRRMSM